MIMSEEIEELLHWFDNTLKNYELDKKSGQLSVDSIYHLFPNQQQIIIYTIKDLQQRISKAVEYIEKDTQYDEEHKYYDVDVDDILNILSILKGKDVK